ncbi:MAG: S9 family peptidase [Ktedonobacteraceae bacterium]
MKNDQQTRVPVTPGMMETLRIPADAQISPDGQHVAYVVMEPIPDLSKRQGRIWVVDTQGGEPRPLTKGPGNDNCPRWSPDNQHIAYISKTKIEDKPSKAQLYLMTLKDGETRQVCTMPDEVSELDWSPDGQRIAFLSRDGEEPTSDPLVMAPNRHQRLWTIRPDYDIPEAVTPDGLTVWEYAWSPDSKHFALYYSTGSDDTDWYRGQIGIIPAGGGDVRQLTNLTRQASALTWSPDSSRLAFMSGEWSDPCQGGGDVFILSLTENNAEPRNLTPGILFSPAWCRWFPDGQRLLYTAWDGLTQQIGILNESDGTITPLVKDFVMSNFWPCLSTTSDLHRFATTHTTQQHPYDVWLGEMSDGDTSTDITLKQLTQLNPIAKETFALAPGERISYPSSDGWRIDALFNLPVKHKSETPPPLFVFVHGGPSWAWLDDIGSTWTQTLAAAGYAVLRANIRGSWGRGVAFADAVIYDMGGKDLQDLLDGVDYLIERGLVDGNRVAIGGGSYGGFMSAWAITQTTRFKAAIMSAGVSDFHSFHAQSRIFDWDMRFLGGNPLEHPELYRERSPITYAARVQTPTLITHGEEDHDVPINQAHAFYRALRERNVPVEFVIYPREGHGLSEREHRKDCEERILRWLERYL